SGLARSASRSTSSGAQPYWSWTIDLIVPLPVVTGPDVIGRFEVAAFTDIIAPSSGPPWCRGGESPRGLLAPCSSRCSLTKWTSSHLAAVMVGSLAYVVSPCYTYGV